MKTILLAQRIIRVLLTQLDTLLYQLAEHKDPERHEILSSNKDLYETIAAYGVALKERKEDPDTDKLTATVATNQYRLLIAKKKIMKDLVTIIDSLENALGNPQVDAI